MKVEKKAANTSREGATLTIKKKKKTDVPANAAPAAAPKKKLKRAADAPESKPKKQKRAAEPAAPSDLSDTAETADTAAADAGCLTNFRLSEATVAALEARGIQALFPIQSATFDLIFGGDDLIGRAHTGCGKTLACLEAECVFLSPN